MEIDSGLIVVRSLDELKKQLIGTKIAVHLRELHPESIPYQGIIDEKHAFLDTRFVESNILYSIRIDEDQIEFSKTGIELGSQTIIEYRKGSEEYKQLEALL